MIAGMLSVMPYARAQQPVSGIGSISGSVTGEDGSRVTTGVIIAHLVSGSRNPKNIAPARGQPISPTGAFQISPLLPGTYRICVQVPGTAWLNPCEWGLRPSTVTVSSTQLEAVVPVVLKKGALVPIRIDDASQLLTQHEGTTPGAHLLLGVINDMQALHLARLVSQDTNGRNHEILIPFGASLKLVATSAFFKLAGTTGLALKSSIPLFVAAGQQPLAITVVVTGRN